MDSVVPGQTYAYHTDSSVDTVQLYARARARAGMRILGTQPSAGACPQRSTSAYATATPRATAAAACCRDITAHATLGTTWGTTGHAAASAELACAANRCGAARCPRGRPQACPEPELARARRLGSHLVHRSGATLPSSAQAARRKPARSTSSGGSGGWSRGSARAVAPPRNARRQRSRSLLARACEPTSSSLRLAAQHARSLWIGYSERTTHEDGRYQCKG